MNNTRRLEVTKEIANLEVAKQYINEKRWVPFEESINSINDRIERLQLEEETELNHFSGEMEFSEQYETVEKCADLLSDAISELDEILERVSFVKDTKAKPEDIDMVIDILQQILKM